MSLSLRNRQFAGNICLVVFLAFMFTLLPGQLFTGNAYAAEEIAGNIAVTTSHADTNVSKKTPVITLEPITESSFTSTISALLAGIGSATDNLVYKVTYNKVASAIYSQVYYSVYLWYYGVKTGTIGNDTYKWYYDTSDAAKFVLVPGKVWRPPTPRGSDGGSSTTTTTTPIIPTPTTPETPTITPAKPATPVIPIKLATYIPTAAQVKVLNVINKEFQEDKYLKNAPQASNVLITVGKAKLMIPKIVVTSAKVVVIMPLTSNKLDAKAVNYKIGIVKNFLAAKGIKNIPVRFVFVNANAKLKVNVKPGSYFKVVTEENLAAAINSSFVNKTVVASKAKIMKAFGIKVTLKKAVTPVKKTIKK